VLQWVLRVVTAEVCSFFTSWNLVLLSDELGQSVSVSLSRLPVVKLLRLREVRAE
jgi:hypothetical protein